MDIRLSAVTVNWKHPEDTVECLLSILQDCPDARLLAVNNDASETSSELIRSSVPGVEVIETGSNVGYVKGINRGIAAAMEDGATHILIINNDAVLEPGAIKAMLDCMDSHPNAAIVGPKIFYYGSDRLWFAGGTHNRLVGYTKHPYMDKIDCDQAGERKVDFITGCVMLVRVEVFERVGLFDEAFVMYLEDLDLCLRAEAAGMESWYTPRAMAQHKVSLSAGVGGSNHMTPLRSYYYARNMFLVIKMRQKGWRKFSQLAGQFMVTLPYYLMMIIMQRSEGAASAYLKGLWDGALWSR